MSFLYGILGTILVMALFSGGVVLGWKLNIRFYRTPKMKPEDPIKQQKELERMKEEQEAWRVMQDYSVERAYGMVSDELGEDGGVT